LLALNDSGKFAIILKLRFKLIQVEIRKPCDITNSQPLEGRYSLVLLSQGSEEEAGRS